MIFTYVVQNCPTFPEMHPDLKSSASKKVTAFGRYVIFPLFKCTYLGKAFSHCCPKTRLDLVDLAEFLIFFSGNTPVEIGAFRLKIGCS